MGRGEGPGLRRFTLVAFALVAGLSDGVGAQRDEGGQEHGALELIVAAVRDAPRRGSMSPISWLLVPGRRRRPAGLRCLEGLPRVSARKTAAAGTPIPGTRGQDLAHEGGPPARVST